MRHVFARLQYPVPRNPAPERVRRESVQLIRFDEASMQPPSDEQLMQRVVEGDGAAFDLLVTRHLGRAVSLAQSILGVAADADEAGQEVFVKLWARPRAFDATKARFTTWLHRVVVNYCIDRRRGRRFEPLEAAMDHESPEPPPLEHVQAEQSARAVSGAMTALPIRQRTALALFYMHDLSQREAAAAMDLTDSAFESLLHRARAALGAALRAAFPGEDT
jgi:RNA polymerase sigma-70 factor (ECF subfamily)